MSIFNPLARIATTVLSTITTQTWGPLVSLCKNGTLTQLQSIKIGTLVVSDSGLIETSTVFGHDQEGVPSAFLHVHSEKFWVRVALFADMVREGLQMVITV
jgi:cyclopropane-fatty-acyl-phospholipid synthase